MDSDGSYNGMGDMIHLEIQRPVGRCGIYVQVARLGAYVKRQ